MPKTLSEQNFENAIVADLVKLNGFHVAGPTDYDRELCLIPHTLVRFLQVTQPQTWKELRTELGDEAESRIVKRVRNVIEKKGTLHVLRKGVDESGCHFELCFFPSAGRHDPELDRLCAGNFFQVLRDEDPAGGFKYSLDNDKSLDVGIFLNGLPVFTTELKNPVSGQNVSHAITQYQQRRDPKEPLFRLGRCLAHFAIDTEQVFMTSALDGKRTRFFAFNQGCDGGAGNPPSRTGIATAYLWREVWTQDSILDLVRRFVQLVDQLDDRGRPTGKKIQKQFQPYYDRIKLTKEVEPDKLYDIRTELEEFGIYTPAAIDAFCEVFYHKGGVADPGMQEPLSKIIEALNQQFGTKFTPEDRVVIEQLELKLGQDPQLEQQLAAGSKQAVRMSFEEVAQDLLHGLIDSNFKFYKKVQDDQDIAKELFDRLFERYLASKR